MQATSAYPQARPLQLLGGQVFLREIAWIQHFPQTPGDRLELGEVGQSSSAFPHQKLQGHPPRCAFPLPRVSPHISLLSQPPRLIKHFCPPYGESLVAHS